jgi:hypothetical protein
VLIARYSDESHDVVPLARLISHLRHPSLTRAGHGNTAFLTTTPITVHESPVELVTVGITSVPTEEATCHDGHSVWFWCKGSLPLESTGPHTGALDNTSLKCFEFLWGLCLR